MVEATLDCTPELKTSEKERLSGMKPVHGNDQLILRQHIEAKQRYFFVKRAFDVFISLFTILFIFTWLYPILYLLIKIDSRGPVFFVQKRVGYLGRSFSCLKFRTMYVNADAHTKQAVDNDPRITRVGNFLRKSNLDELPQFLNVLAGHMSIVGPRPHMHQDCINFSQVLPEYRFRHLTRPGITGLAQVKGLRGPAQDFEKIAKRYQWDAFYIRNAGFWMDMRIIRKTAAQTIAYIITKIVVPETKEQSAPETNILAFDRG